MIKKNTEEPICAVDFAFKRIGGKYKGRIIWYLHKNNIMRYGELKRSVKDITTKMLTQTLRELETDNLIYRKVYKEVPPKVEYFLTETGIELIPFINHLRQWGVKQMKNNNILGTDTNYEDKMWQNL